MNSYRFRLSSTWRVPASVATTHEILRNVGHYSTWWPSVIDSSQTDDRVAWLRIAGFLPYSLTVRLSNEIDEALHLRATLTGDMRGWCSWQLAKDGAETVASFAQHVDLAIGPIANAPRPIAALLRLNHEAVMRDGERALRALVRTGGYASCSNPTSQRTP